MTKNIDKGIDYPQVRKGLEMGIKWHQTGFKGVTAKKHETRKHGVKFDEYFRGQYQAGGKRQTIGFGWSSEGWTAKSVYYKINEYKTNAKQGQKPTSLKEEQAIAKKLNDEMEAAERQRQKENITLDDFFHNHYLTRSDDRKPETKRREKSIYKNWIGKYLGHLPIKEIGKMEMEDLKTKMMKAKLSPRSIQYTLAITRQIFNEAIESEIYNNVNPANRVKKPRFDNARNRFLDDKEAQHLLGLLAQKNKDLHDTALISYDCGLRAGEIFNLKVSDIDFESGIIHLRNTKNSKTGSNSRDAFMTDAVKSMLLDRVKDKGQDEYVYPDKNGNKRKAIQKQFWAILDESGLNDGVTDPKQKIVFHSFRHSFASRLVNDDVPLYIVQKLLGHQNPIMTQRYSHLQNKKLKEAAAKLNPKEEEPKETPPEEQETPDNIIKFKTA